MHATEMLAFSRFNLANKPIISPAILSMMREVAAKEADNTTLVVKREFLTNEDLQYLHYNGYKVKDRKKSAFIKISWGPK